MSFSADNSLDTLLTFGPQRRFTGEKLLQIAFPLGGIGAGCICLNGQGGLQDLSIRNAPTLSALPDGHGINDGAFAVIHLPGSGQTRLLEGPLPVERIYDQGLKGQGFRGGGHEGLPRFKNCAFQGEFPFGYVDLSDPGLPLSVQITGFNPFIPLDDKNASLPCAVLEYTFTNNSSKPVAFEFSYHITHFARGTQPGLASTRNRPIPGTGAFLYNEEDPDSAEYGSCALGTVGFEPRIKAMWFRGGWFDSISVLWKELSTGTFTTNDGAGASTSQGLNGASILIPQTLAPGQQVTIPVVIAWYFPNVPYAFGEAKQAGNVTEDSCSDNCDCHKPQARWHPYYTSQWKDAGDVLIYVRDHYDHLRSRTQAFHDALFSSTLPNYVLDAVSANLDILKSPTVLRQANGNVWAWEGCFSNCGCCHGSCTHVWNYAQAMPHLFPALERTLREQELLRSMDERGHVTFRAALPDGPTEHNFHAAADGQLGGIMKVYREWSISGNRDWLLMLYPSTKRSMDYCIATWDPDHQGVLMEPHHNTYDIEFWGPDGMCTSFYLGALAAMAKLARAVGKPQDAAYYEQLGQRGAAYLDEQLFNGEYFYQQVMLNGLRASPGEVFLNALREANPEEYQLLTTEGPKYQYGTGCMSDGVFGAWLARLCGVETYQNKENIRRNLKAIFDYNFRSSLWRHANTQRPGYAVGDEPGLLVCTWPKGGKPTLPFVYSDEVWTGIEYQTASHMIAEGLVAEGLTIVQSLRSRFDGQKRNPWNEYECGSYYARAMASYALLYALSGFRYSAPDRTLYLEPRLDVRPFRSFFSTASGWGTITIQDDAVAVEVIEGNLALDRILLTQHGETRAIPVGEAVTGSRQYK